MDVFQSTLEKIENKSWRNVLEKLESDKLEIREAGYDELRSLTIVPKTEFWVTPEDLQGLIKLGLVYLFRPQKHNFYSPNHELLMTLLPLKHQIIADTIFDCYSKAIPERLADGFTLLAAQTSFESSQQLSSLIEKHGFPEGLYPRSFWELEANCVDHAYVFVPHIILKAESYIGNVVNYINEALAKETIARNDLTCLKEWAETQVRKLHSEASLKQQGENWRNDEEYRHVSMELGPWVDLAGNIIGFETKLLEQVIELKDQYLVGCAIVSQIKQGENPTPESCLTVAASHENRSQLFSILKKLNKLELYPNRYYDFESFAASDMANWLSIELDHAPDELTIEAIIEGTSEHEDIKLCLWRFADADKSYAGISGPYSIDGEIGPISGSETFSNFELWDSMSPEEHVQSIQGVLENWSIQYCEKAIG